MSQVKLTSNEYKWFWNSTHLRIKNIIENDEINYYFYLKFRYNHPLKSTNETNTNDSGKQHLIVDLRYLQKWWN